MLCSQHARGGTDVDNYLYVGMNMHWECHGVELPALPADLQWHVFANTAMPPPEDIWPLGSEPRLTEQRQLLVGERSVVILIGKRHAAEPVSSSSTKENHHAP